MSNFRFQAVYLRLEKSKVQGLKSKAFSLSSPLRAQTSVAAPLPGCINANEYLVITAARCAVKEKLNKIKTLASHLAVEMFIKYDGLSKPDRSLSAMLLLVIVEKDVPFGAQ